MEACVYNPQGLKLKGWEVAWQTALASRVQGFFVCFLSKGSSTGPKPQSQDLLFQTTQEVTYSPTPSPVLNYIFLC